MTLRYADVQPSPPGEIDIMEARGNGPSYPKQCVLLPHGLFLGGAVQWAPRIADGILIGWLFYTTGARTTSEAH